MRPTDCHCWPRQLTSHSHSHRWQPIIVTRPRPAALPAVGTPPLCRFINHHCSALWGLGWAAHATACMHTCTANPGARCHRPVRYSTPPQAVSRLHPRATATATATAAAQPASLSTPHARTHAPQACVRRCRRCSAVDKRRVAQLAQAHTHALHACATAQKPPKRRMWRTCCRHVSADGQMPLHTHARTYIGMYTDCHTAPGPPARTSKAPHPTQHTTQHAPGCCRARGGGSRAI